jgi:hypothetical protein
MKKALAEQFQIGYFISCKDNESFHETYGVQRLW